MVVLSLFDGIACCREALDRAGIYIEKYYASEIDKHAIAITQYNHPDTIQLGDVTKWVEWVIDKPNLITGGFPCQPYSLAGKRKGLSDKRGGILVDSMINIIEKYQPEDLMFENVKGLLSIDKGDTFKSILKSLNNSNYAVDWLRINSSLVSAQNRDRVYILGKRLDLCNSYKIKIDKTNKRNYEKVEINNSEEIIVFDSGVSQPEDKKIFLKDIVLSDVLPVVLHNLYGGFKEKCVRVFEDKSPTIRTAAGGGHIPSFVKEDFNENPHVVTFTERRTEEAKKIRKEIRKKEGRDFSPRRGKEVVPRFDGKANCITATSSIEHLVLTKKALDYMDRKVQDGRTHWNFKHHSDIKDEKSATVVANFFKGVPYNVFKDWNCIRKFDPIEAERLQTMRDDFTKYGHKDGKTIEISTSQRLKAIGNAWTIDVVAHILKNIKEGV